MTIPHNLGFAGFVVGWYYYSDPGDYGQLYAVADATYVYYNLLYSEAIGNPITWTGTNLQITTHVFVEDIGV
jgi:hypothetical protein